MTESERMVSESSSVGKSISAGSRTITEKGIKLEVMLEVIISILTASIPGNGEKIIPIITAANTNVTYFLDFALPLGRYCP